MTFLRSPKHKLLLAGLLILGMALLAPTTGASVPNLARWVLAALAVLGLVLWRAKARRPPSCFKLETKLEVLARTGLSPKCGVALVEADGRKYLIVHGDGFATVRQSRPHRPSAAPRAVRSSPRSALRKLGLS